MTKTKHTPGPWSVIETLPSGLLDQTGKYNYDGGAAVLVIAKDDCEHHPIADCSCNHTCRDQEECEANARLIAASPRMAEILRKILVWANDENSPHGKSTSWFVDMILDVFGEINGDEPAEGEAA